MGFEIAYFSDAGKLRTRNEDFIAFDKEANLIVICDGMGGHRSGEIASKLAGQIVLWLFRHLKNKELGKITKDISFCFPEEVLRLISAIRLTNWQLFKISSENEKFRGMGTTLVALFLSKDFYATFNIGDSRIYRIKKEKLDLLTEDHTLLNELLADGEISHSQIAKIKRKNVITRALGIEDSIKIDVRMESWNGGELFLICTDGLTEALTDENILRICLFNKKNLDHLAKHLIDDAIIRDGSDNVTVAIVKPELNSEIAVYGDKGKFFVIPAEDRSISKNEERFWRQIRNEEQLKRIMKILN